MFVLTKITGIKMMKRILLPVIFILLLASLVHAQFDDREDWSEDKNAVYDTILTLFEGMRNSDASLIKSVFIEGNKPIFKVINIRNNQPDTIQMRSAESFIEAAGQKHEKAWDERIWNTKISIDGSLASAWTPYGFFLDNVLQHCGVNSIQLFKSDHGWKIVNLAYTRRTMNCEIPDWVSDPK